MYDSDVTDSYNNVRLTFFGKAWYNMYTFQITWFQANHVTNPIMCVQYDVKLLKSHLDLVEHQGLPSDLWNFVYYGFLMVFQ